MDLYYQKELQDVSSSHASILIPSFEVYSEGLFSSGAETYYDSEPEYYDISYKATENV